MKKHEASGYWPIHERIEKWFFQCEWYDVYNLVEFIAHQLSRERDSAWVCGQFNEALQAEGSKYRFVQGELTQITDSLEIQAVQNALATGDRFSGAREHLTTALRMLGQRPQPDYRNAIKESISAVESTLKVLTDQNHADLAAALREFANTHPIHGALFRGLNSLYGYTSNEHGLRHALLDADARVGFAEAKFMIVACAAFVSFLIMLEAQ